MREVTENTEMIAMCGLYCGTCSRYLKQKCNGCKENDKASWCKLRSCCLEKNIVSCAECDEFKDVMLCKKYNNLVAKIFGFVFNSDRAACITKIKEVGYDGFACEMVSNRQVTFKRK